VLLSDPDVVRTLNERVVAYWESVRPVPKVTIDFGDGRVLHRTLGGNTVMLLCLPDGRVLDAFPGIYAPRDFLPALERSLAFAADFRDEAFVAWHRERATQAVAAERIRITTSKAFVESPLLEALGMAQRALPAAPAPARAAASDRPAPARAAAPDPLANPQDAFHRLSARIEDVSKGAATVERLRRSYLREGVPRTPEQIGREAVELDSRTNTWLVRPAVHLFFVTQGRPVPREECVRAIFREVLHVPVDDPYLGLADALVPGTP